MAFNGVGGLELVFDESGNTGPNLSDPSQPVCVVASSSISIQKASDLLKALVHGTQLEQQKEVKFTSLRSRELRRRVLDLLKDPAFGEASVKYAFAIKRDFLTFKFIDLVVEPYYHSQGVNAYKDGYLRSLAHLVSLTAPVLSSASEWASMLAKFSAYCREPGDAQRRALLRAFASWRRTLRDEPSYLDELVGGLIWFTRNGGPSIDRDELDPALPLFVDVAREWGLQSSHDFAVVHDSSKLIDRWQSLLQRMDSLPDPAREGQSLPRLRIADGGFRPDGRSESDPRLQVVDLVAGAARTWTSGLASGTTDPWQDKLRETTQAWCVRALLADKNAASGDAAAGVRPGQP